MSFQGNHLYDFGPFRLDLGERLLLKDQVHIPLAPKTLETLVVLVQHSGRIVDKDELLQSVWPDTFVEEATLAKNISILRKTLGETEEHRYIETIPKRGYRFTADVRVSLTPPVTEVTASADLAGAIVSDPAPRPLPVVLSRRWWWAAGAAAGLVLVAAFAVWKLKSDSNSFGFALKAVPLTSFPGHQDQVAFSPDGNQVAFKWEGTQGEPSHIFVKLVGSEALLQVTHGDGADSLPAWSPDGKSVYFLRSTAQGRAWYITSALGGAERKIADLHPYLDLGIANSSYLSPDGKTIAFSDKTNPTEPSSIFLLSLADTQRRQFTTPPRGATGDYYPAFSPDGRYVAFARALSFSSHDLYVQPLAGGPPQRLTFDGLTIDGLAWTPDSREIVFASHRGASSDSLWRIAASGGTPQKIVTFGEDVTSPAISRAGGRLAYTRRLDDLNIWLYTLDGPAKLKSKAPLVVSTFRDSDPDFSPDGRKIAFTSGRNGSFGIWVVDRDGTNPLLLFDGGAYVTGSPKWSPDGRRIVFDTRANDPAKTGNPSIWVVSVESGEAKCLVAAATGGVAPAWSRDGAWIYYASTHGGSLQIWKIPSEGGATVQVTHNGGFEGFETEDGKSLLYMRERGTPGIWRVPVDGGPEVQVTDRDEVGRWRCWRVGGAGIYYATATSPEGPRLMFLETASGKAQKIATLLHAPDITIPGLSIAPDGRSLLLSQYDQSGSNIIIAERPR